MSNRIIITGATGFIGKVLSKQLVEAGYDVLALSRNPDRGKESFGGRVKVVKWDAKTSLGWLDYANGAYAIVNLTGENIGSGKWDQKKKQRILQSRLDSGKAVLEAVEKFGYKNSMKIIIDSAASEFYVDGKYKMRRVIFTKEGLLDFYLNLLKNYPIVALEDPFTQDDWEGFSEITEKIGKEIIMASGRYIASGVIIFGDDLLATNVKRIKEAKGKEATGTKKHTGGSGKVRNSGLETGPRPGVGSSERRASEV